ncbi:hypothetical protein ACOSQ3_004789 [Xanthoceras sorbifolium]
MDHYSRKIQCIHCRQRLSPQAREAKIKCPGCALDIEISKPENERSSRENSNTCPKNIISKFWKPTDPNPKTPLNIVPSPFQLPHSSRPNKRAVLCGVTYNKRKYRLKGTINDVKNIRDMLIKKFGFLQNGIIVLTEEETQEHIPTKKNIEKALRWLVENCKKGDSLVFYFSGHGLRQPDFNGDETDGFDETICPLDFIKEGMIVDNDINSIIVQPLVKGVTLHAIVDACHSGTILDLKYKYNRDKKEWKDNSPPSSGVNKATSGGLAICISACADDQVASDTTAFTGNTMNGAMTYILTKSVRKHPGLTYGDLIDLIHEAFEEVNQNECLVNTHFLRKFYKESLSQKPQLTSSEQFDVYKTHFKL